jgi:hypothetical protein
VADNSNEEAPPACAGGTSVADNSNEEAPSTFSPRSIDIAFVKSIVLVMHVDIMHRGCCRVHTGFDYVGCSLRTGGQLEGVRLRSHRRVLLFRRAAGVHPHTYWQHPGRRLCMPVCGSLCSTGMITEAVAGGVRMRRTRLQTTLCTS